jgi:PAS domain S-box-containing protein
MKSPFHKRLFFLFRLLLCLSAAGLAACSETGTGPPGTRAVGGVLDLRNRDLTRQGPVKLEGQWEFYWGKLLDPGSLPSEGTPIKKDYQELPGTWNGRMFQNTPLSGEGYATYHLRLLLNASRENLAFKIMSIGSAYRLYVNGRPVAWAGRVGTSRESSKPDWRPMVADFTANGSSLDLVLQVSNFHHRKGGVPESIWLGSAMDIRDMREKSLAFQLFLSGSLLIMGLYHLALFLLRKNEKVALYFGLYSILISLYSLLVGERYFLHLFPAVGWEWRIKLTNLSSFLSLPFFILFIQTLFPKESRRKATAFIMAAVGLLSLVVLVTPSFIYTQAIPVFHVLTLMSGLYSLWVLILAFRHRQEGAGFILLGTLIIFTAAINDVLYDNGFIQTGQLIYLGFFLFIFIQSFSISLRFAKAFETIENQTTVLAESNRLIQREMNERLQAEKALEQSEKRYRDLLEEAPIGFCTVDLQGNILYVNRRLEEILGKNRETLIGKNSFNLGLTSAEINEMLTARMAQRLSGAPSIPLEVEIHLINGSKKWLELTNRIMETDNHPAGFQIAVNDTSPKKLAREELQKAHDLLERRVQERTADLDRTNEYLRKEIDARKQIEANLKNAKETAEKANLAKSEFLANMSHELRTPLNHVIGFTEMVVDGQLGKLNPEQEEYLNDVLHSGRHLLTLINDILDLSKVEAGKLELNMVKISLSQVLENSLIMVKEKALRHNIRISADLKGLPETFRGDERKIKQVLYNLLANAVKFTAPGGTIHLSGGMDPTVAPAPPRTSTLQPLTEKIDPDFDGPCVKISIVDNGIGLDPQDLERIFSPFEQVDNSARRRYQGTGLGLTLARQMIELHGGKLWAESEGPGQGAGFHFTLPVRY